MFVLQISSGVGPAEVRRFVGQLAVRLERLAEERGLLITDVVTSGDGDGAAPRSVALHLAGDVGGALADELGTHVLIGRSARRGRSSRKRWFAAVTLHAAPPGNGAGAGDGDGDGASLPRDELIITACRAGGPGGQHVNKVSTAVRVQHLPSGLSVRSAGHRSQKANLDHALHRLASLLAERTRARRADDDRARRQAHYQVERGRPVRAYALGADGALVARSPS